MSEIKVDKLQGTSGSDTAITLSGANATVGGTLAVTGVHTIGTNAVYTSDAGAVTQNVVQGMAKGFCRYSASAFTESFNFSTFTDNSTGDHNMSFTNNMNNSVYVISMQHEGGNAGDHFRYGCEAVSSTSLVNMEHFLLSSGSGPTQADLGDNGFTIHGDLA